jgi:hypothetical protein
MEVRFPAFLTTALHLNNLSVPAALSLIKLSQVGAWVKPRAGLKAVVEEKQISEPVPVGNQTPIFHFSVTHFIH